MLQTELNFEKGQNIHWLPLIELIQRSHEHFVRQLYHLIKTWLRVRREKQTKNPHSLRTSGKGSNGVFHGNTIIHLRKPDLYSQAIVEFGLLVTKDENANASANSAIFSLNMSIRFMENLRLKARRLRTVPKSILKVISKLKSTDSGKPSVHNSSCRSKSMFNAVRMPHVNARILD